MLQSTCCFFITIIFEVQKKTYNHVKLLIPNHLLLIRQFMPSDKISNLIRMKVPVIPDFEMAATYLFIFCSPLFHVIH